ncbi:hypothetical protein BpJC7_06660 [Weizmannia acidilactici]|uniref:Uncharacterized protein n=2 Tax=Weizmannia acidilactici TaxID=2607726 RepID=A0A5J4JBR5_9BACI|nr:hypothetical protein BpJC4_09620 [Weizmannia acidilactici]GER69363.1 hypothetical protein BpJC7_06660 [Weizmannia acidilactici]
MQMKQNKPLFEMKQLIIWKIAIASSLSWEIAKSAGSHHPYLAPLTVILCIKAMPDQTISFAVNRMIGTMVIGTNGGLQ